MAGPRNILLHIAVVLCMVTMAATDESRSPAMLYVSKELDNTSSASLAAATSRNRRKAVDNARRISCRTVPSVTSIVPKPKRAKFEPRRRQEVANVRKKGACMRCRIKKLSCSGSLPCGSCQRIQVVSRMSFDRWEQCVSFSMKEVNIYVMDYLCNEETYGAILGNLPLVADNASSSFDDMIKWDVRSISSEFVLWMSDDDAQTGSTSLVGILSSSAFECMISKFVDSSLSRYTRLLVKLTSILYSYGSQASYANCDSTSLWSLCSFAGTKVLRELELALGTASLAAASRETLTALFLVLFTTIIAVGYSKPRSPSGDQGASRFGLPIHRSPISTEPRTPGPSVQVFPEAQKHLLRILAHHMVYIAERIDLLDTNVSRKRIIEETACRWNRRATFQLKAMPIPKDANGQSDLVSSYDTPDNSRTADETLPTGDPAHYYHLSRSHPTESSCRPAGGFGTCVHEQSMNAKPSPLDIILASHQQTTSAPRDVQARTECTSPLRVNPESTNHARDSSHRHSSHHSASMCAKDGSHAAFESLAEADAMCGPFLSANDDDNADEAASLDALPASSAPQSSEQSFSAATGSPPRIGSHDPMSIHDANSDQASVCRSCRFAKLPFGTLDQDELCQFCSALPQHGGDAFVPCPNGWHDDEVLAQDQFDRLDLPQHGGDAFVPCPNGLPDDEVLAQDQFNRLERELESLNLLV
ncbi:MAG: hypothetical protein ASARMPRED_008441 [Alectoria sarmentosa]|nr:MAG: hypothetical protein ASARMPRED_008441 [Alectoria sarmentosa]